MVTLEYRSGYVKALIDFAEWIDNPQHPLDKKLCQAKRIDTILGFIIQDVDDFMSCPELYDLCYEIDKRKRLKLWREVSSS